MKKGQILSVMERMYDGERYMEEQREFEECNKIGQKI